MVLRGLAFQWFSIKKKEKDNLRTGFKGDCSTPKKTRISKKVIRQNKKKTTEQNQNNNNNIHSTKTDDKSPEK